MRRRCVGGRAFESCLGVFFGSSPYPRRPRLPTVVFWTASVEPVLLGRPTAFLTAGVLYDGGLGPPWGQRSSNFSSSLPTSGVHSQSVSLSSLTDPSSAATPRPCLGGSSLVCLSRDLNQNSKVFFSVDSFIRNDTLTPSPLTRSSDNLLFSSRYSRPSAFRSPIGRSGTSDPGGLRWSPHLLPKLCT